MKQDAYARLERLALITSFAGIALAYLQGVVQSRQGELIILSGVCLFFSVLDGMIVLIGRNQNPEKASPAVFPILMASLVLLILIPFLAASNAIRYYKASDNVSYKVKKDKAVVQRIYGGDDTLTLKDSWNDVPVTVIEKNAAVSRKNLKSIVLPKDLQEIGDNAFRACTGLEEIELPKSVNRIGKGAFSMCSSLKRITIPPSVTEIPKSAFNGCPKDMVIAGEPGSAAQDFADSYFTFEPVS